MIQWDIWGGQGMHWVHRKRGSLSSIEWEVRSFLLSPSLGMLNQPTSTPWAIDSFPFARPQPLPKARGSQRNAGAGRLVAVSNVDFDLGQLTGKHG